MKIIFLDFDGVLNNQSSLFVRNLEAGNNPSLGLGSPDPICVRLVDHLIDKSKAKIVVSSSWRQGRNVDDLQKILKYEFGLRNWDKVIDKTRSTDIGDLRGNQIDDYINVYNVDNYVIIDDDSDMLPNQKDYHVHTNFDNGFGLHDMVKAMKILGLNTSGSLIYD